MRDTYLMKTTFFTFEVFVSNYCLSLFIEDELRVFYVLFLHVYVHGLFDVIENVNSFIFNVILHLLMM